MSGKRIAFTFLVTFFFFSAGNVDASSSKVTQCPAFILSSILSSHSERYHLPIQSGYHVGSQKSSHEERIVGGQVTSPNAFPFMVYMEVSFWNGDVGKCGGTLLDNRWILTAAHCFAGALKVTVTLGAHDVTPGSTDQHQWTFNLQGADAQAITYPDWFVGKVEDDIALLQLPQAITLNQWIQPARLPYSDDPRQVGDPVVLTGWGNFSSAPESGLSPTLRQVGSTVIPYSTCQTTAGVGPFTDEKIICGDGSQGNRYCYGDDGGPMNDYREDEQDWFVIGVAWFGEKNVNCQSSALPNLYARVSNYVGWIHNQTGIPPRDRPTTTTTSTTTTTPTTTTTRPTTTEDPNAFSCRNRENGLYPVPNLECTKYFYYCSNGIAYLYDCPVAGTLFYYDVCRCEFPGNVPNCGGYTGEPEMTTAAF